MQTKAVLLVLCALFVAPAAFGAGPLLLQSANNPYEYAPGVTGIYTDLGNCGPTLTNAEADALTAFGYGQWAAVASSYFNAAVVGDFSALALPDITGGNANLVVGAFNGGGIHVMYDNDGTIIANFFGAPPGVLGIASPDFVNGAGRITESWAVMNGTAVDPLDVIGTYFAGVFTHEFGHSINLAHSQTNGARIFFGDDLGPQSCALPYGGAPGFADIETMYPFIDPTFNSIGQDISTVGELDDVMSLSDVYPTGGWPTNTHTVSGEIFLSDGATEVGGVNVIIRNIADPWGDCTSQLSGAFTQTAGDGDYDMHGLTPGANYVVYIDGIVAGGFSQSPASVPGGAEEFHDAAESNSDPRCNSLNLNGAAGATTTADVIINEPYITVNDDGFQEVPLPFPFGFCGTAYNTVFVNANGNLTFGAGDPDFSPTVAEFLNGPPRISGLWADLSPQDAGEITAQPVGPNFEVRYQGIPEFGTTNSNTFTFVLRPDGTHDVVYGTVDATAGLAGRTEGGGAANPGNSDLSALPQPITADNVYQNFLAGFDLDNQTLQYSACGAVGPILVVDPKNPSLGSVSLGDTACVEIAVRNTGDQTLVINSITGCDTGDYFTDLTGVNFNVAAGDSTFFDICYSPTGPGPDSCLVSVDTNDGVCIVTAKVASVLAVPGDGTPAGLVLSPIYPNPFRGAAEIRFSLIAESTVRLEVFDLRGRRVRALLEDSYPGGTHSVRWDGLDDRGVPAAAGVYLIRMAAGDRSQVVRAVRMR